MNDKKVIIIGAGLTGPLLSIFLAKRDFDVQIFEKRPDPRTTELPAGRSINLALSERGIRALREVGLAEAILKFTIPMKGRMIHDMDGNLTFQRYGLRDEEVIYSISRSLLNKILMDKAEQTGNVNIDFNWSCNEVNADTGEVILQNLENGTRRKDKGVVIACDGSGSNVRKSMESLNNFTCSVNWLTHGYKELTIQPSQSGYYQMEPNALHIWPRDDFMLIALPNLDKTFTCTLFFPLEGHMSFSSLNSENQADKFFKSYFQDAYILLPDLITQFVQNPVGKLGTVQCFPWYFSDKILLLGDAVHAIVPFFGQGMNCSFEDCTILDKVLFDGSGNWESIFSTYASMRKKDTNSISEMALENYIEMRQLTTVPDFQLKKQIEFALEEKFPKRFIPRYSMVSFHSIPYSEVKRRGTINSEILQELTDSINTIEYLDWEKAEKLVTSKLNEITD